MAGLTNFSENLLLTWAFTNAAAPTRPTAWYVALHTGDPGEDGDENEVDTSLDADYERKVLSLSDPVNGLSTNEAALTWTTDAAATTHTATHASIKTALTGGDTLMKGPLAVSFVRTANSVKTFEIGNFIAGLD